MNENLRLNKKEKEGRNKMNEVTSYIKINITFSLKEKRKEYQRIDLLMFDI